MGSNGSARMVRAANRRTLFGPVPVKVVARRTGLHLSYLYYVLACQRRLSFEAADKVARALKISLDELRRREKRLKAPTVSAFLARHRSSLTVRPATGPRALRA